MTTGVGGCGGGCRGGCGDLSHAVVRAPRAPGRLTPTPAQAANIAQSNGSYGDWVTDVPVQGPTDEGIRRAGCWWKNNVLDKVTDDQGAMVPRWTQSSLLCLDGRPLQSGVGGETVRRRGVSAGALGADPAPNAPPAATTTKPAASLPAPPGIWSKLTADQSHWVATTLIALNDFIVKAGNKLCASWPADLLKDDASATAKMPAAVGCFQSWYNLNLQPDAPLRTDGTLDERTACALVATTGLHANDFPTPYPGVLKCGGLSLYAKVGIGAGVAVAVGGAIAAVAAASHKKKKAAPAAAAEARRGAQYGRERRR